MNVTRAALLITVATGLSLGCGSASKAVSAAPTPSSTEKGAPQGAPTTATIGATGGSLTSADGKATLTVPAGALSADVELGLQAVSGVSPGAIGSGWRLTPDGQTFTSPVTLSIAYADEALVGVPKAAVAFATQRDDGVWKLEAAATLDEATKIASASISHFSDWSLVFGVQMRPAAGNVKVGQSQSLSIAHCFAPPSDDDLAWLSYDCDPTDDELAPLLPIAKTLRWSVNGVEGGGGEFGSVTGADNHGVYKAPGKKPSASLVAVSAEVTLFGAGKTLVVSNLTITDDSAGYTGTFSASLTSTDLTYTASGTVQWDQTSADKFRSTGTAQVAYSMKCGTSTGTYSGARPILVSSAGNGELRLFPSLGWYGWAFALEPFEVSCNGVSLPVNLMLNPCDNLMTLLIGSDPDLLSGTGTCGAQQLTWSWTRK
jgi:hypothetical protein